MNILALPTLYKEINKKMESADLPVKLFVDIIDRTKENGGFVVRVTMTSVKEESVLVSHVYAYGRHDYEQADKRAKDFTYKLQKEYGERVVEYASTY
ncbi:hypothetical protein [Bacillus thuringiensis]|uniref:hypothetical protein n=1 Tax=Bacillus thuringiensis TaxID=1428 RepID=UPI000BFB3212|nr:hypothetical protein [Bacillus thuringiensis]PGT89882.1 hypothetical protein COD17_09025 [Bacillus thuringiensis]